MNLDFIIHNLDSKSDLSRKIISHLLLNRVKANKPTILLLVGSSGEGKSYTGLSLLDGLLTEQGIDTAKHLEDLIIFTPLEYAKKVDNFLHNKELKKVNVMLIDEAREVVKAHLWYSFLNQAIADVNAMSRGVKPMVLIIVSQFIKDIDPSVRRTLTFYGKCTRPLKQSTRLRLYRLWHDDYNLERPMLKKRRVIGIVKDKGIRKKIRPILKFRLPPKELMDRYEKLQFNSKSKLIRHKLEALLKTLQSEYKDMFNKVDSMVDWYVGHPEFISTITERKRGKVKLKKEVNTMHDLTKEETKEFEKRLMDKLAERGLANVQGQRQESI